MNDTSNGPRDDLWPTGPQHFRDRADRALHIVIQAWGDAGDRALPGGMSRKSAANLLCTPMWHALGGPLQVFVPDSSHRAFMLNSVWFFDLWRSTDRKAEFIKAVEKVVPGAKSTAQAIEQDDVYQVIDAVCGLGFLLVVAKLMLDAPSSAIGHVFEAMLPLMGLSMPDDADPAFWGAQ